MFIWSRLTLLEICRYLRQIRPGFKVPELEITTRGGKGCVKVCVVIPNDFRDSMFRGGREALKLREGQVMLCTNLEPKEQWENTKKVLRSAGQGKPLGQGLYTTGRSLETPRHWILND